MFMNKEIIGKNIDIALDAVDHAMDRMVDWVDTDSARTRNILLGSAGCLATLAAGSEVVAARLRRGQGAASLIGRGALHTTAFVATAGSAYFTYTAGVNDGIELADIQERAQRGVNS